MSAPRYVGWHHLRVEGDQDAAKALIPFARKVLGFAVEQAAFNSLGTYKHVHRLPDGGRITADLHGNMRRVTIFAPAPSPDTRTDRLAGGFVCWPRSDSYVDGFNPSQPAAWIATAGERRWSINYFDRTDPPWQALAPPKGVYAAFPSGEPMFPDGLYRAGNIDWSGRDERLSWYGPRTRYWPTLDDQAGKSVFHLGRLLLAVDAYATDNARPELDGWVLGAAMHKLHLYVVTSSHVEYRNAGPATHRLTRYRLRQDPPSLGIDHLTVQPDDHADHSPVVLWESLRDRSPANYFFNADATVASRVGYRPSNGTDSDDFNELLTLMIDPVTGAVAEIAEAQNFDIRVTTTEVDIPDGIPGTTYYRYDLDAPVVAITARDYRGMEAVDVTITLDAYTREPRVESDGSGKIEYAVRAMKVSAAIGRLELVLVDQVDRIWQGNQGSPTPKPFDLLSSVRHWHVLAMDARADKAAVAEIHARYYGDLWRLGLIEESGFDMATLVASGAVPKTVLSTRTLDRESAAAWNALGIRIGAPLFRTSGPIGTGNSQIAPLFGQAHTVIGYDNAAMTFDRFIDFASSQWEPGIVRDATGFRHSGSIGCLLRPDIHLFAGMDVFQPGQSLSHSNGFHPFQKTGITGARQRLHPVWVLELPKKTRSE